MMQAVIVTELEKLAGKPLNQVFDLAAGTSVGSIVSGCIAAGVPAAKIIEFFTKWAPTIFSGSRWFLPRVFSAAKYNPQNLRTALYDVLGSRTLADCKPAIFTAIEVTTGRLAYFQTYGASSSTVDELVLGPDSGMPLVDAMMASSAAQSYFPGHPWKDYVFWDGGSSGFNCPDMLALVEARLLSSAGRPDLRMLSLGGGSTPWPYAGANMETPGLAKVAGATLEIAYSGPEAAQVWMARSFLGKGHYRLNPACAAYSIDDASENTLASLQSAARACLDDNPGTLPAFCG